MNLRSNMFEKRGGTARILHDEQLAAMKLANEVSALMPALKSRPIVLVCIGTDRSTGDSLGPLVGTLLEEKNIAPFHVYGTLEDPIHAVNLEEKLREIEEKHFHPFIIGVDACLGRLKSVGIIQIGDGPVKPGAGVNKELPPVGDIHITGIVNVSGFMEFFVLQNTRLNLVLKMAKTIAEGIYAASLSFDRKQAWHQLNLKVEQEHTL
ncbi:spore protease YyaC [Bacillus canaveralius]|uniref:Spore protease YyaC n=1 Tax=Bacillus canaveralius TaxID=1403243 RepID=A0A2N5GGW1_9BACI|nr:MULTISPECIES: spore protease YyaC [Bacillus]PLR79973.1 spore protease YyaC [Bacillus canaveralius]PLR80664.1 spore protease YyaC [Bacillus sp. V33-4]PLR89980.1 spore protease YyaC [Bacillus canaveralius]RSK52135.1 spore protease YyaC [Bacillus canaveralius]